jgi:hypothetical protein
VGLRDSTEEALHGSEPPLAKHKARSGLSEGALKVEQLAAPTVARPERQLPKIGEEMISIGPSCTY